MTFNVNNIIYFYLFAASIILVMGIYLAANSRWKRDKREDKHDR